MEALRRLPFYLTIEVDLYDDAHFNRNRFQRGTEA